MSSLSEAQVRHYVAQVREKVPQARLIGIRTRTPWSGPSTLQVRQESLPIVVGQSPLQIREALLGIDDGPAVLLTHLNEADLGADVIARLARHRLYAIDSWQILLDLFHARSMDPRLGGERPLAEALLEVLPERGPTPVAAGILDYRTAWTTFLRDGLGYQEDVVDLRGIVEWSAAPRHIQLYLSAPEDIRPGLRRFLLEQAGPATSLILGAIEAGHGENVVPLGLVCRAVFSSGDEESAAVRLESLTGNALIPPEAGLAWAAEADAWVERQIDRGELSQSERIRNKADTLLRETLRAEPLARHSRILPSSFEQRLAEVAEALGVARCGEASDVGALALAVQRTTEHIEAARHPDLSESLAMLPRMVRWLHQPVEPTTSFAELARSYVEHGSFVDWARDTTWGSSSRVVLEDEMAKLQADITERREEENRRFAHALAEWSKAPSSDAVLPIEGVLQEVVVPVAQTHPVLLLVLDGMGLAVFQALLRDIEKHGWIELQPETERNGFRPVVAVPPSVTHYSRASLLAGGLTQGDQAVEKRAFAQHAGLCSQASNAFPPRLFHKGDIRAADGALESDLMAALLEPRQRVLGIVLNAVDDHLDSGGQVHIRWTAERIGPLLKILDGAADARRAVVIVADHGHVVERKTTSHSGEGERWRRPGDPVRHQELELTGPRIPADLAGKIVVPWSESLRYGPKKAGYHGGATPQEMLIPLAVLCTPDAEIEGWVDVPSRLPHWWTTLSTVAHISPIVDRKPSRSTAKPRPDTPQGEMFDPPAPPEPLAANPPAALAPPPWVADLLSCQRFAEQRERAKRQPLADAKIVALLDALDQRGGTMMQQQLAQLAGISEVRLRGTLATLRKILNIEGFPILEFEADSGTVRLNRELLVRQFEIGSL
jgi:hypothetical protein